MCAAKSLKYIMQQKKLMLIVLFSSVFIMGLYLRCESVKETIVIKPLRSDARNYYIYAFNLRHKHIYSREIGNPNDLYSKVKPDADRAPGYPIFLMPFVTGLPNHKIINSILLFQVILSMLTLFISLFYFRHFLPHIWVYPALLLLALSPHLVVANSYILTETLLCLLMTIFFWQMSKFFTKPSRLTAIITGIVMGMAHLVRPNLHYFFFLIALFFLFYFRKNKTPHFFLFLLAGFLITNSFWTVRNITVVGEAPRNERLIMFLAHGMYPELTYEGKPESYGTPYRFDPNFKTIQKDTKSVLQEIKRRFTEEPLRHIKWYALRKPFFLFSWHMAQGMGDAFVYPVARSPYFYNSFFQASHYFMRTIHEIVVTLCLFGCFIVWFPISKLGLPEKEILIVRFTSIFFIYIIIIHTIGTPLPRYSVPLRPIIYGMAVYPLHLLTVLFINLKKRRDSSDLSPP